MTVADSKVLVVIGVDRDFGLSAARRFGREGYRIGLVGDAQDKLDCCIDELKAIGIEAEGFAADVLDGSPLQAAFSRVRESLGSVDLVECSATIHHTVLDVLDADESQVMGGMAFCYPDARHADPVALRRGATATRLLLAVTPRIPSPSVKPPDRALPAPRRLAFRATRSGPPRE
jgi:NAD(P)-dependent dehydrogenase (short-subunit alcohol dehydrogenase family)